MKGRSCYFNLCWLIKIHPETARKRGRGTFPFPSTSNAIFARDTEKHFFFFFFPNLIIKIQSCYFWYIVDLQRLQYAGAESGLLCVPPTPKHVGAGSPVQLSSGVRVGRKKGWQDTALILPSVQTRCQGKDVSPWGKKISPHPEPVIPTFWQNKSKGIKLGCSYNRYSNRMYLELSLYRVGWREVNLR